MGGNLRRRGGVFWFRRRVPDNLQASIGRVEINRTLQTSCVRTARGRARRAWLATEAAFQAMSGYKTLSAEQAELVIARLLREPIWDSPTATEVVRAIDEDDHSVPDLLFRHAHEILPTLDDEDASRLIAILGRFVDRTEIGTLKTVAHAAELKERVATIRGLGAQIEASRARQAATKAASDALTSRVASIQQMAASAAQQAAVKPTSPAAIAVPVAATAPPPPPVKAEPTPAPDTDDGPMLLSKSIELFFRAKRYPPHTEHQNLRHSHI